MVQVRQRESEDTRGMLYLWRIYISSFSTKLKLLRMSIGLDDLLIGGDALGDLGVLHDSVLGLGDLALSLVESLSLDLPLSLQSSKCPGTSNRPHVRVFPESSISCRPSA